MDSIEQYEEMLVKRIEELSYIVSGLENNDAFNRLIKVWEETKKVIDDNWHLQTDQVKLMELRITKLSALNLINMIPNMKNELSKYQKEFEELKNPDSIIKKDYDEN